MARMKEPIEMVRSWRLYVSIAALLALIFVLAGCSGGFGPTLPSPDGEVEPPTPSGQLCVTVQDGEGQPIAGAYVYVGNDGQGQVTRSQTDSDGQVCFSDLAAGQYGMTTAADGLATDHTIVEVTGESQTVTVTLDDPVEVSPTVCPVVSVNDVTTDFNEEAGTTVVSGTVQNADSGSIIILHNGQPTATGLETDGSFSQLFFLTPGVNEFQVLAGNAACTIIYPDDPIQLNWTPPEGSDFVFRVTMTWNEGTSDPDLHTWSPNLAGHSSYHNMAITGGQLDVDDTEGFGPENFTATQIIDGRWRIAVNSYDLDDATRYGVTVRVITGGLAANSVSRVFGPHTFTTDNGEGYPVEPPNWWRPCDIVVAADGTVSVVAPDGTALTASVNAAAAPAK